MIHIKETFLIARENEYLSSDIRKFLLAINITSGLYSKTMYVKESEGHEAVEILGKTIVASNGVLYNHDGVALCVLAQPTINEIPVVVVSIVVASNSTKIVTEQSYIRTDFNGKLYMQVSDRILKMTSENNNIQISNTASLNIIHGSGLDSNSVKKLSRILDVPKTDTTPKQPKEVPEPPKDEFEGYKYVFRVDGVVVCCNGYKDCMKKLDIKESAFRKILRGADPDVEILKSASMIKK